MAGTDRRTPPRLVTDLAFPPPSASDAVGAAAGPPAAPIWPAAPVFPVSPVSPVAPHGAGSRPAQATAHRPAATRYRFADDQTTPRFPQRVHPAPPRSPARPAASIHPNVDNTITSRPTPSTTRQQPATPAPDHTANSDLTGPVRTADPRPRERIAGFVPDPVREPTRVRLARAARAVTVVQGVCWPVAAAILVLASWNQPLPRAVPLTLAALAILAATAVRTHDRWLYQLTWTWLRYLRRTRVHPLGDGADLGASLLALLLPGATRTTMATGVPEPTQDAALTLSHRRGMTALLRPAEVTPTVLDTLADPVELLPPGADHAVQAVFHSGVRAGATPRVWLAVHAERTTANPFDAEVSVALRNALRRVRHTLARAEVRTEPLTEPAALAAVAALAHVTGGRNELRETWSLVHTGPVTQACFTLDGWDRLAARDRLRLAAVVRTAGAGTALTLTVTATARRTTALLRLAAASAEAIDGVVARLGPLLCPVGVRIVALDGAHTSGIAASLPIGGFLS